MAVQSKDLKNGEPVGDDALFEQLLSGVGSARADRPLLNRSHLDKSLPYVRALVGLVLLAYGALSTIDGVRVDCGPLCVGLWQGLPVWQVAGIIVAVLLSVGQWFTSDRYPTIYYALLLVDIRYTQWWADDWIMPLTRYHVRGIDPMLAVGIGLVVSYALAYGVARFAELLLFGRRK